MTPTAKALLVYFVIVLVVIAWMFRLDAKPSSTILTTIVTDRWFGPVEKPGRDPRPVRGVLAHLSTTCKLTHRTPPHRPNSRTDASRFRDGADDRGGRVPTAI